MPNQGEERIPSRSSSLRAILRPLVALAAAVVAIVLVAGTWDDTGVATGQGPMRIFLVGWAVAAVIILSGFAFTGPMRRPVLLPAVQPDGGNCGGRYRCYWRTLVFLSPYAGPREIGRSRDLTTPRHDRRRENGEEVLAKVAPLGARLTHRSRVPVPVSGGPPMPISIGPAPARASRRRPGPARLLGAGSWTRRPPPARRGGALWW
jgi:hypothetical protein